jgi:hypothetical protein
MAVSLPSTAFPMASEPAHAPEQSAQNSRKRKLDLVKCDRCRSDKVKVKSHPATRLSSRGVANSSSAHLATEHGHSNARDATTTTGRARKGGKQNARASTWLCHPHRLSPLSTAMVCRTLKNCLTDGKSHSSRQYLYPVPI